MTYATGFFKPEPTGLLRPHYRHLAARLAAAAAFAADLSANLPPVLNQVQTSSCVEHATAEGIYAALKAAGTPLAWIPSPDALYKNARAFERQDPNTPLVDDGSSPHLALRAVNIVGVKPMGDPHGDRMSDVDPSTINDEPTLLDLEEESAVLLVGDYGIYDQGADRGAAVRQALTNGVPTTVAVPGGSSMWQRYTGGVIGPVDEPLDHDVLLCAYRQNAAGAFEYKIRNSWGAAWGLGGDCWVSEAALGSYGTLIALSVRRVA